ncbi:hypothetical protein C8F04DRAFT_1088750 [Mycena alexandri]|uniref:Golgi apparatus membrane protein TVP38 n=1 Tax=Mycena alexandri TaxID=1745969 RepID=A0AAD6XAY0_9AGAR|nr:hypothetical protein C8F04DRAFT_1088750 [Mycena alexandri]
MVQNNRLWRSAVALPPYKKIDGTRSQFAFFLAMSTHIAMPQPTYASYPPSNQDSSSKANALIARSISRTPSPTPSETDLLNGVKKQRTWKEMIRTYIIVAVVVAVVTLIEVFHEKIINALTPVTRWLHDTKAGWLIPIVVLIAMSFPPLFGHEIVGMLCGLVWGLGEGFGIVAAGTILGEMCTFYIFRLCLGRRAKKWELTNIGYGTLSYIIRDGGLLIPIVVRYSSLPSHFTTAIFATCGIPFGIFLVAAIVSLPKQVALVYIGVALGQNTKTSNRVQRIVIGVTVVITVVAMVYIRRMMAQARPAVIYARRKARQAKLRGSTSHDG